jgi:superfamily I DNA/RNA helicase
VDRRQIPSGQYQAVLIDEGHDFAPEWLKLVTQMVDPATNSLLVLYDDAQSIYERARSKQFSFKSVGIQAQGRTTILKINYRNTGRSCRPPAWSPPTC